MAWDLGEREIGFAACGTEPERGTEDDETMRLLEEAFRGLPEHERFEITQAAASRGMSLVQWVAAGLRDLGILPPRKLH